MYAYLFPCPHDAVYDHPYYEQLRVACPRWARTPTSDGATLVHLPGTSAKLSAYGDPEPSADLAGKVMFLPPKDLPTVLTRATWRAALAREVCPPLAEYRRHDGTLVSLGLGVGSPASLLLSPAGDITVGRPTTELGRCSYQVHELCLAAARDDFAGDENELLAAQAHLLALAYQAAYMLTIDAINALELITTDDLGPGLSAVWGADPKPAAVAGATSQPSAAASSPTPSLPPKN